ncbi:Serine/threonine-protein kinase pkn6 [Enhygromyxa salina]|uniref:Serine/threonine-protein kinase pkn6 n=2 Tax=Enhygromyxa salina TaxID=215803 RepID=A0A2S9XBD3_9BACT|nr:Serine/threonine-protein kinase pkn6 [Enhygromyxa salina]
MGGATKTVAIKLLASHLACNPVYRRMFVDEARLTMMLNHSNIVQVFDVGEQRGRSYLVMEWVDGLDLSRLGTSMRESGEAFEIEVVAHIIGEVLRGLVYAHGLSEGAQTNTVVHRDISPHNVLISVSGEVKISDFGVARLASEDTSGVHVRGKLRYMPPEQVRGESKSATVDLFAVGAMMQELLDGVRFRAGLDRDELFGMVMSGDVPDLVRTDVPAELLALRDALLAKDPDQRPQSATEALELLREWPGFAHLGHELAVLVRGRSGVEGPRTGLTVASTGEEVEVSDEPTVREGSFPPDSSELATRTVRNPDDAASETTPRSLLGARAATRRRWRRPVLMATLASFGICLGFGFAWMHGEAQTPPEALADEARPEPAEDRVAPKDSRPATAPTEPTPAKLEPTPAKLEPTPAKLEPAPEAQPAVAPGPRRKRARPAKPEVEDAKPAEVEFAAHEFFFVWVKVAGQQRALEPVATIPLSPGRHRVWVRETPDQAWVPAGRIRVAAGRSYRVSLEKPAGLALARLD